MQSNAVISGMMYLNLELPIDSLWLFSAAMLKIPRWREADSHLLFRK